MVTFLVKEPIDKFITELQSSLLSAKFIKLTLSNYKGTEQHLQKVSVRPVDLKGGRRLMFQYRFDTRDVVKNFEFDDAVNETRKLLESGFRSGHLFTTANDVQLTVGKKNARLTTGKPSIPTTDASPHNREKKSLIDPNAFYLKALGIATDDGKIRSDQRDKWKQINKFVEILAGLIENSSLKNNENLRIVDMGSGKGYLTFALYDYLLRSRPKPKVQSPKSEDSSDLRPWTLDLGLAVTGIELRPNLVALCNDIAKAGGFDGLNFVEGTIADTELGDVDILIALHACDTATDDALYKGITANAAIIVAAPCCHKEIKKQMKPPELLASILKHPVMLERTAETITDGIRSMLLESKGYKTKMFEFVATEHTPKNNLLVATKLDQTKGASGLETQIDDIRTVFGISSQRLFSLIAGNRPSDEGDR